MSTASAWDPGRRAMVMPPGLQPGAGLPWADILADPPADLLLAHDFGHAYAPDSPAGRTRLELHPDGRLELGWWREEAHRYWTARCDPALVARFIAALREAGFPRFPGHRLLPGVSFRLLEARVGLAGAQAPALRDPLDHVEPFSTLRALGEGLSAAILPMPGYAPALPVEGVREWTDAPPQTANRLR